MDGLNQNYTFKGGGFNHSNILQPGEIGNVRTTSLKFCMLIIASSHSVRIEFHKNITRLKNYFDLKRRH